MATIRRKVVHESVAYGPRGGEYRRLELECGHTVERYSKRLYRSKEEECARCSWPELFIQELGLAPTQEAALRRLYEERQISCTNVSGVEARALAALVLKGFATEGLQADGGTYFKLRD